MFQPNSEQFAEIVQRAFDQAEGSKRWQMAIVRAKVQLEENPFIEWQGDALLILSPSNQIYSANGACQCKAYEKGFPCWHRAAARLVRRYNETSH